MMETDVDMETVAEEDNPMTSKSLVELYGQRNEKLYEIKKKIANYCHSVISHPEINMMKLRNLLSLFDLKSDDKEFGLIFFSIQKLVALAALEVFKDILPNYRVKEKINEEDDEKNSKRKNFQLKKETKRLREYEKTLIQLYRLYLNRLQRMVDAISSSKAKKSDFYEHMLSSNKSKQRIAAIGLKCMSQLVLTHPHFNFRQQIVETIVQMMANNKYTELSDICCQTVSKLFKSDKLGEISLEAVKEMSKLAKQRNYRLDPKVLRTLLSLRIKEVKQRDEISKKDMRKMRIRLNLMSRKERKRNKRMQKLDNQLLEVDAQESLQRKLDFNTEILNQIFITYFRILKNQREIDLNENNSDSKWFKALLTPVLEGLSRFAHLINIEFFYDLISLMYELIRDKRLNTHQTLHCLQTVFTILSGEGRALNIDFQRFYSELYVQLLSIDVNTDIEDIEVLLSCLDVMIIKRKKQMTQNRVLSFIKRLSTVSTQTSGQSSVALLSVIRQIMLNHKKSDILLDTEALGIGSGIFLPEIDDPEHSNANSTLLWELPLLTTHFEPLVQKMAKNILNMSSNELPIPSISRGPTDLLNELIENNTDFQLFGSKQQIPIKKKHKINYNLFNSNTSLASKCLKYIQCTKF